MLRQSQLHWFQLGGFLLAASLLGCGGSEDDLANVTGTVKMDGKPLEDASVQFVPKAGGRPSYGRTDAQGAYTLESTDTVAGAKVGMHRVRISTLKYPGEDEEGRPIPGRPETVPPAFHGETTTLEREVQAGENVHDFELDSTAEVPPSE